MALTIACRVKGISSKIGWDFLGSTVSIVNGQGESGVSDPQQRDWSKMPIIRGGPDPRNPSGQGEMS